MLQHKTVPKYVVSSIRKKYNLHSDQKTDISVK